MSGCWLINAWEPAADRGRDKDTAAGRWSQQRAGMGGLSPRGLTGGPGQCTARSLRSSRPRSLTGTRLLNMPQPEARPGDATKASLCLTRKVGKPRPGQATRQEPLGLPVSRTLSCHARGGRHSVGLTGSREWHVHTGPQHSARSSCSVNMSGDLTKWLAWPRSILPTSSASAVYACDSQETVVRRAED